MNSIGVDCHISTLEIAVVNERGIITKYLLFSDTYNVMLGFNPHALPSFLSIK